MVKQVVDIDLPLDLQTENESGLPYMTFDRARHPERVVVGNWIVVGTAEVNAVARVVDIDDNGVVEVEPLPGPASKWLHLLHRRPA